MTCHKCSNTNEGTGYIYGFCDACAKSILAAAATRYARKANTTPTGASAVPVGNKKLEQDLKACERDIAALGTAVDRLAADDLRHFGINTRDSWQPVIHDAIQRYTRALTDHRLLWSMYRRADKSTPYYQSQPTSDPVRVATRERELVAA